MRVCTIENCNRQAHGRWLCAKHYQRWKSHGDPLFGKEIRPSGSGSLRPDGYFVFNIEGKNILEHVLVAERALGKPLPTGAQVHHWDKDHSNNSPTNLVICPDQNYRRLLHRRMDALDACGNPNWMRCTLCGRYDDPMTMYVYPRGSQGYHRECSAADARMRRTARASNKPTMQFGIQDFKAREAA